MKQRMKLVAGISMLLVTAAVNGEGSQQSVGLKTIGTDTYYVEGQFEGVDATTLLVDTGSGYSTINQDTLSQLKQTGNAVYLKKVEGIMADGSRMVVPIYRISGVSLGGKCIIRNIEAAVFPAGSRQILGLSALRKVTPFVFSLDPPSLILSNCTLGRFSDSGAMDSHTPSADATGAETHKASKITLQSPAAG